MREMELGVVLYAVKMYLACGLKLKKKLLPLMIKLVVILNNLGVIHLWQPKKMANLWRPPHPFSRMNNRSFDSKQKNLRTCDLPIAIPCRRHKCLSLTCFVMILFFCFGNQSSKCCLKTFLSLKIVDRQSKEMTLVMLYFGILCGRMRLLFTIQRKICQSII